MKTESNIEIRHARADDKAFWLTLDKHISPDELDIKIRDGRCYIVSDNGRPIGILRYNLFWDNIPFCTLLYMDESHRGNGYGKRLVAFWENEMQALGYNALLTSTQADEDAQHFYRKLGYTDCGSMTVRGQSAAELFLIKYLS